MPGGMAERLGDREERQPVFFSHCGKMYVSGSFLFLLSDCTKTETF